jgi:hypothetical protein
LSSFPLWWPLGWLADRTLVKKINEPIYNWLSGSVFIREICKTPTPSMQQQQQQSSSTLLTVVRLFCVDQSSTFRFLYESLPKWLWRIGLIFLILYILLWNAGSLNYHSGMPESLSWVAPILRIDQNWGK